LDEFKQYNSKKLEQELDQLNKYDTTMLTMKLFMQSPESKPKRVRKSALGSKRVQPLERNKRVDRKSDSLLY
jgi:hypothetical protein